MPKPGPPDAADAPAELPPYEGLARSAIHLVATPDEATRACEALLGHAVLGFDTESKPTFAKGEASTGPHLIQFASDDAAWLFQVRLHGGNPALRALLASPLVRKVGFGLRGDIVQLRERMGIEPGGMLDLSVALPREERNTTVGAKTAVARYLGRRMLKSRRVTTSNWSNPWLNERQLLYAANDARAALQVYREAVARGLVGA